MSDKKKKSVIKNPNEPQKVKDYKGLKKFLKFTALFMVTIIVVVLGAAAYAYLSDQIDPDKVYITELNIEGQKEYVTISQNDKSFKTTVSFLPENANQLNLTTKIVTGSGLIESMPTVTAGKEFEIFFAKDERGITKGGEIEIKFLDSSQSTYATLKVLIDVGLNSNYINVSNNGTNLTVDEQTNALSANVLTSINKEYAHVLKINAINDEMFNSYKGNWSESENNSIANLNRLKKMLLFYDEKDSTIQGVSEDKKLKVEEVLGDEKYYLIEFLSPASSIEPFILDIYIYKTYYLETIFPEEMASELLLAVNGGGITHINYDRLNLFINNYVVNNCSVEAQNNFANFLDTSTGLILLQPSKTSGKMEEFLQAIKDVVDYALVGKKIQITVENIVVDNIDNAKGSAAIEFQVLKNINYDIKKVNTDLGITLTSDDAKVDTGVLFNNLRKLEIFLCETSDSNSDFNIDGILCSKVSNNRNEYFELIKTMDEGVANWTLKTLSPTPTYTDFYLVYRYRNNEMTEAVYDGKTYYYSKVTEKWHSKLNDDTYTNEVTAIKTLEALKAKFNDVFSISRIITRYNSATITFNQAINNYDYTNFVLNDVVNRYTEADGMQIVNNGDYGVYYEERAYKAYGANSNVVITPKNEDNDPTTLNEMEYTMIKWFVPYAENIVGLSDPANLGSYNLSDAQYYFMPTLHTTYTQNLHAENQDEPDKLKNYNPIPYKVKLAEVGKQNSYLGGDSGYFMEVGMGDFTLKALNAMKADEDIPLYAVIIQTDINNEPYKKDATDFVEGDYIQGTATEVIYHYIAATDLVGSSGHDIRSDYYLDNLKFYVESGGSYLESSTNENGYISLDQSTTTSGSILLSNFDLSSETILSSESLYVYDEETQTNEIVLLDAIDIFWNQKLALENYYNNFYKNKTNKAFVVQKQNVNVDSISNKYSVTVGSGEGADLATIQIGESKNIDVYAIQFNISCTGVGTEYNKYIYTILAVYLDPVKGIKPPVSTTSNNYFFTATESSNLGVFVLNAPTGSGGES